MRFRPGRLLMVSAFALVLAGCGAGLHSSALPSGAGTLRPQLNGGPGNLAQPTLYVAGQGAVYAYDLGASGDALPVTHTTGYYYQAGGPNGVNASIAGIATNLAGDLVIAQNFSNPQGDGNSCQLVYVPARTGPAAADTTGSPCGNSSGGHTTGLAVGVTFTQGTGGCKTITTVGAPVANNRCVFAFGGPKDDGPRPSSDEIDVLMRFVASGNPSVTACASRVTMNAIAPNAIAFTRGSYEVDRYQRSSPSAYVPVDCVALPNSPYAAIGGSAGDAFFVDFGQDQTFVDRYDGTDTKTNEGSLPGVAGPIAVAANPTTGVGYRVVATVASGITTVYTFKVSSGNTLTFTHALGTFTNPVGALAVDNNGTVYVGVNQSNGATKIKVYGPSKTQATDPDYILNNPVRRPNPAASPAAVITGIAIAQ